MYAEIVIRGLGQRLASCAATVLVLAAAMGCAPQSIMVRMNNPATPIPAQAEVVFVNPYNAWNGSSPIEIWDREILVGVLEPRARIHYLTSPGEHVFIGSARNQTFLKATLVSGRRYFIAARSWSVPYAGRFSALDPITREDKKITADDIDKWLKSLTVQSLDPVKGQAYANERQAEHEKAVKEYDGGKVKAGVLGPEDNR